MEIYPGMVFIRFDNPRERREILSVDKDNKQASVRYTSGFVFPVLLIDCYELIEVGVWKLANHPAHDVSEGL